MINFTKDIADKRMQLTVGKDVDECLVVSENGARKEFLNVNANRAKGHDDLTSKT